METILRYFKPEGNEKLKKGKPPFNKEVTSERYYPDQRLVEFTVAGNHLICYYANIPHFTCSCSFDDLDVSCKHIKNLQKVVKKHADKYDSLLRQKEEKDSPDLEWSDEKECLICYTDLDRFTKYVKCETCKRRVHKACWKHWQLSITRPQCRATCVFCCQNLPLRVRDNENKIV